MRALQEDVSGRGPYERAAFLLMAHAAGLWPHLPAGGAALSAPPWFAERLATETGKELVTIADGLQAVRLGSLSVGGVTALDGGEVGRFVAHDLLYGTAFELSVRCHPGVAPHDWPALTLALGEGLNPALAVTVATVRP